MSVRQAMKAPRWKWLLIILFWTAYATCFMKWLQGSYVALITLPWLGSLVTFHVAHDASHGALSTRPWLNELLTFSSFLVGAPHEWYWQHVALHHVWILGNKKKQHFFSSRFAFCNVFVCFNCPVFQKNGIPPKTLRTNIADADPDAKHVRRWVKGKAPLSVMPVVWAIAVLSSEWNFPALFWEIRVCHTSLFDLDDLLAQGPLFLKHFRK